MKSLDKKVKYEDENGNVFNMTKVKEFTLKEKKYAVLAEEKTCDHDCSCCDENLAILEVSIDSNGKEKFITISDEKTFKEVATKAEELFRE